MDPTSPKSSLAVTASIAAAPHFEKRNIVAFFLYNEYDPR